MPHERMTPGNVKCEKALLGVLLINAYAINVVAEALTEDDFCIDAHQHIYRAMHTLYRQGMTVNLFNVTNELTRTNTLTIIGEFAEERSGEYYLDRLQWSLDTLNPIEDLIETIKQASIARHLLAAAQEMAELAYTQDPTMVERAEQLVYGLSLRSAKSTVATMDVMIDEFLEDLEQRRENFRHNVANGIPTNFTDLDQILGGLQPGEMYILAARPAVGKTSAALNITSNIVQHARHVLFYSLEMKRRALIQRLVAMDTPMDQMLLRSGDVHDDEMKNIRRVAENFRKLDLKIDDGSRALADIRSTARAVHAAKPLDLLVLDYLQLVRPSVNRGKSSTREQEVAEISREMKSLAMELNIPILVLAQLSRDIEKRGDKTPMLSDLRESGSLEQDSDNVLFLHVTEDELEKKSRNETYSVRVIVAKQRNGRVGDIELLFKPRSTKFVDKTLEATYAED